MDVGTFRVDAGGSLLSELRTLLGGEAARVEERLAAASAR
jgi:hypothetical protein